jgi:hypothetical protein
VARGASGGSSNPPSTLRPLRGEGATRRGPSSHRRRA